MKSPAKPRFIVTKRSRTGRARLGILKTPNGIVLTPAYVIVATHAKCAPKPRDIKATGAAGYRKYYHLWEKSKIKNKTKKLFGAEAWRGYTMTVRRFNVSLGAARARSGRY